MNPEALAELDRLLEHRIRLAICVLLRKQDRINFTRFKTLLDQTDGSLGAQLRKLEDAGYISAEKTFEARKPVTWYALTETGTQALARHVDAMQALLGT